MVPPPFVAWIFSTINKKACTWTICTPQDNSWLPMPFFVFIFFGLCGHHKLNFCSTLGKYLLLNFYCADRLCVFCCDWQELIATFDFRLHYSDVLVEKNTIFLHHGFCRNIVFLGICVSKCCWSCRWFAPWLYMPNLIGLKSHGLKFDIYIQHGSSVLVFSQL